MGKTFSCTVEGCDMVFSREYQLRKHKATHDDPDSLHYCQHCDFYTFDPRNLEVHIAIHTGEKNYECPDILKVRGLSGSLVEEACAYKTNDRSLLTKHRIKVHGYKPRPRACPQRGAAFTFIPYPLPSSVATTSNATSRVINANQVQKRNATTQRSKSSRKRVAGEVNDSTSTTEHAALADNASPSTSQEGVDEHKQMAHVDSLGPTGSGSIRFTGSNPVLPVHNEHALLDVQGQRAYYVGSPDTSSTLSAGSSDATSIVPNEAVSLDTHGQLAKAESLHVTGSSTITPVTPNQDIVEHFNSATDYDWSRPYIEDLALSSHTNLQMDTFATGGFQMMTGHDGPGIQGWDEATWNNFWAQSNSLAYI